MLPRNLVLLFKTDVGFLVFELRLWSFFLLTQKNVQIIKGLNISLFLFTP